MTSSETHHTDLSQLRLSPREKRAGGARRQLAAATAILALVVVGLIGLAVALSDSPEEDSRPAAASTSEASAPIPRISRSRSDDGAILAGGYVEARRRADLMPGRDGVISKVLVELGQRVEQGQLLLELESDAAQADREIASAELELARSRLRGVRAGSRAEEVMAARSEADAAEADWQEAMESAGRLERLAPSGATTAAEVDRARHRARAAEARVTALRARERLLRRGSRITEIQAAEANVARAEAALRRAEALLELCRLRAPFDGVIDAVDIEPGEAVSLQSGRSVLGLADLSEIRVRVDVPETRIVRVRLGAPGEVMVDALGEARIAAEVIEIAPSADRQSNTVSVAVRLTDPPAGIRPNMSARVSIRGGGAP